MSLSIGHLLLYSPLLSPPDRKADGEKDEDAQEAAQVAFYYSNDQVGTRDGMLRSLGLAKGLGEFVKMMALKEGQEGADSGDDGSTVITSTHSTLLTLPLESSFSLHVKFTTSASSTYEPSEPLPPASSLKALVQQACRRFYLLHGPLSSLLPSSPSDSEDVARTRRKVHGTLERFWSEWIEHFPACTDQLISKSHGLRLPPISVTPTTLPQPLALLSRSTILTSPSAQLPSELLHHLLTLVPQPPAEVAAPQPQNGVVEKEGNKWWDGLGTGMSTMTLGLGRSGSAPPSDSTEKKTSFPASSLWKKATTDLFSFGSSASTPPSPGRLPVRTSADPKAPVDVSLPPSTPSTPIEDGEGAKAVDPESLKEAIEQELPEPEPISLSWTSRDFWLSEAEPSPVAFTLVPDRADSSISNQLFVYLSSPSRTADHPSLASLLNFASPSPPPPTPPAQVEQQAHEDQRSFHPPPKPTLSRSPSAISLLSTFSTPPRPTSSTPAKNVSVCGLMKGRDGRVGTTGSWKPIDEGKRERSLVRNLDLLSEPEVEEVIARTSLSSTWLLARHTSPARSEVLTVVESKGITLADVDRLGRVAERELERQAGLRG